MTNNLPPEAPRCAGWSPAELAEALEERAAIRAELGGLPAPRARLGALLDFAREVLG